MNERTISRVGYAVLAALMAVVVILTAAVAVKARTTLTPALEVQSRLIVRGGVIRLGPDLRVLDDQGHASVGIARLSIEDCNLVIWTDAPTDGTQRVVSAIVDEDETLSAKGVQAGISGGLQRAVVYLYGRNGDRICAKAERFGSTANIWVSLTAIEVQ